MPREFGLEQFFAMGSSDFGGTDFSLFRPKFVAARAIHPLAPAVARNEHSNRPRQNLNLYRRISQ
jgi:hypothetical protein